MRITTSQDGSATAAVSMPAPGLFSVLVQARDFPGGPVESAAAFFNRGQLEQFRDQLTAALSDDQDDTAAAVRDGLGPPPAYRPFWIGPGNGDPSN
jgi:hypothetical protein